MLNCSGIWLFWLDVSFRLRFSCLCIFDLSRQTSRWCIFCLPVPFTFCFLTKALVYRDGRLGAGAGSPFITGSRNGSGECWSYTPLGIWQTSWLLHFTYFSFISFFCWSESLNRTRWVSDVSVFKQYPIKYCWYKYILYKKNHIAWNISRVINVYVHVIVFRNIC